MYALFASSVCMTLGHLTFVVISHEESFIKMVYMTGCATSLLNHYFRGRNKYLKALDRTVVTLGAVNDLRYIYDSYTFSLWFAAIYFYVYSKIFIDVELYENAVIFHVLAHVVVTMCHTNILVRVVF